MPTKIEEAFAHLGAILMQTAASDDKIIIGHVRDAHGLLQDVLRAPSPTAPSEADMITVPFNPCLKKLRKGEPFFVLLGRDKQAPNAVRTWARDREIAEGPSEWVEEARNVADTMAAYSGAPAPAAAPTLGREALDLCEHAIVEGVRNLGLPSVAERFEGEFVKLRAALTAPDKGVTYETCSACGGSGLMLGGAGEPTECSECKGNTVAPSAAGPEREALRKIAGMPTESNEWDGVDKFRECRAIACKALDARSVAGTAPDKGGPDEPASTPCQNCQGTGQHTSHREQSWQFETTRCNHCKGTGAAPAHSVAETK